MIQTRVLTAGQPQKVLLESHKGYRINQKEVEEKTVIIDKVS